MDDTAVKSLVTLAGVGVIAAVTFGVLNLVSPRDAAPPEVETGVSLDTVFSADAPARAPESVTPPPEPELEDAPDVREDEDPATPEDANVDEGAERAAEDDMDTLLADVRGDRQARASDSEDAADPTDTTEAPRTEQAAAAASNRSGGAATASAPPRAAEAPAAAAPARSTQAQAPTRPAQQPEPTPTPVRDAPPPATAMVRWWPGELPASGFGLRHAGQLSGDQAIALLFTGAVDGAEVGRRVKVLDAHGKPANNGWSVSEANARMAVLRGLEHGRYTVIIDGRLSDVRGRAIGSNMQGPVYIN